MPSATTGWIVGGYITLAPKCESSSAALYDILLIVRAVGTTFGFDVIIPGTSVHISRIRALQPTAYNDAV